MSKCYVVTGRAMSFYDVRYVVSAESEDDAIRKVKAGVFEKSEITKYIVPPKPFDCKAKLLFKKKKSNKKEELNG